MRFAEFLVMLLMLFLVGCFGFCIYNARQEYLLEDSCKKHCAPTISEIIKDRCLCATDTGWEPKK